MRLRWLVGVGMALLWLFPGGVTAQAAAACQFRLGFAAIHDRIPAVVGACLDDEQHNAANGDALQHTTRGLLVWRKFDNWTAFTDGFHTWVNGPYGLLERLNTQRFRWEGRPGGKIYIGLGEQPSSVLPPNDAQPCFDAQPTPMEILRRLYPTDVPPGPAMVCSDIAAVLSQDVFTAAAGFADSDPFCRCQNLTDRQTFAALDATRYLVTLGWGSGPQSETTKYTVHFARGSSGWLVTDIRCGGDLPNTSILAAPILAAPIGGC